MEKEPVEELFFTTPAERNIGDVLVVGGGISGIQASLDLADMGLKVYLVDKLPAAIPSMSCPSTGSFSIFLRPYLIYLLL